MSVDENLVRLTRLKEQSMLRREGYVQRIQSIYVLAQHSVENSEIVPQLWVAVDRLDEL